MSPRNLVFGIAAGALLHLIGAAPCAAETAREAAIDVASIRAASATLVEAVKGAVKESGGDPERESVRLILAFSTGHFGDDPAKARGAREVANHLLAAFPVAAGDRVQVWAYEMGVWSTSREHAVRSGDANELRELNRLFPLTARAGTLGGHDTERAISEIGDSLLAGRGEPPAGFVMILLANDAASVNPEGGTDRTWGENDPRYLSTLERLAASRVPPANKSGASVVLPLKVALPDGREVVRDIQAVIVRPKQFAGARLTMTRPAGGDPPPLPDSPPQFPWPAATIVAVVLAAVVLAVFALRRARFPSRKARIVVVAASRRDVRDFALGQEICHVAGPGYPEDDRSKTVEPPGGASLPPIILARVRRGRGLLVSIRGEDESSVVEVDGTPAHGEVLVRYGEKRRITLAGSHAPEPYLPPAEFRCEIEVAWETA